MLVESLQRRSDSCTIPGFANRGGNADPKRLERMERAETLGQDCRWPPRRGIAPAWRRLMIRQVGRRHAALAEPLSSRPAALGVRDARLAAVEAALFDADEPLSPKRLARLADLPDTGEARRQVTLLNQYYRDDQSAFHVDEVAGGFQLLTRPEWRAALDRVLQPIDDLQLSEPTLETLAIVAYRQPICRADVEAIRGVQVADALRFLMDKGLVRLCGRDDSLGRPYLYGTTKRFLQAFGLRRIADLPMIELLSNPDQAPHGANAGDEANSNGD